MTPSTPSAPDGRPPPPPTPMSSDAASPARYAYLVARLRGRQITMEEATELFALLQGMLRDSQMVRARLERATPPPPASGTAPVPPASAARPAVSDDFLLLGLLAIGAGAGLGAAFARRLSSGDGPAGTAKPAPRRTG